MTEKGLKNKDMRLSDVSILSAHEVEADLLADFYNNNPLSNSSLSGNWKWKFYSSSFGSKIPLIMVYSGRVIAHVGLMPFEVLLRGDKYKASWMTDLSMLPEFQGGAGMGRRLVTLTKKWMEFSDIHLAIGNDYAINFLNHFGWIESPDTYLHRFLLLPFNAPASAPPARKFLRNALKNASAAVFKVIYKKHASSGGRLRMRALDPAALSEFLKISHQPDKGVIPLRDTGYVNWRLLSSPDREKYRIVDIGGVSAVGMIIKLTNDGAYKYIDILWVSDQGKPSCVKEAIAGLALWGIADGYSMIRYYTSHKTLSDYLKRSLRSIVYHPRFAFYSQDNTLLQNIKNTIWHWELIDSDFELF